MVSTKPPGDEADDPAPARPYVVTKGRTAAKHMLDLMACVRATNQAENVPGLTHEHLKVLAACRADDDTESVTVGDVVTAVPYPLLVARILLSDLIESGAVVHRLTVVTGEPLSPEILQRVHRALTNWDTPSPASDKPGRAC
ncbi:DUF742 domain-containing protein [Streptomyces mirabilis]|uniref:DUF742 domain-containing protein n=1 Tax=Streptomyces mirabilis TaxID=68239 RepID=UPI0021C0E819|nr:DUF742 domain-containing protein [Streptomyces mirabilis]MCT9107581.1 DUF742 domain-containing protein [Streptomyces mirabilis]